MRLLKIYREDHELFHSDVDAEKYYFFRDHIAAFRRMWYEQGTTYWLRFLLSYRDYIKKYNFAKLYMNSTSFPLCPHKFFKCLDFGFISIHKAFIQGDCSSAKAIIFDIFTVAKNLHLLSELESPSLVYDPFYMRNTRDSFRNLFGPPDRNKKAPLIKVCVLLPIYLKFGGAICTFLRRWLSESDVPDDDPQIYDNTYLYWMPFDDWSSDYFKPEPFEGYIASYWSEKLPVMLLTRNINNIFLSETSEPCSCFAELFNGTDDTSVKNAKNPDSEFNFHFALCKLHDSCRQKIIHNSECFDPYFCDGNPPCILTCETDKECKASINGEEKLGHESSSIWKSFEVEIEPCDEKNCRNVGTLAATYDDNIESYPMSKKGEIAEALSDYLDGISDIPPDHLLHPEVLNSIMQIKRVEGTKQRLRNKLDKKQKLLAEKVFEDPTYRLKLLEEAEKKFKEEQQIKSDSSNGKSSTVDSHAQEHLVSDLCKCQENEDMKSVNHNGKKNKTKVNVKLCTYRETLKVTYNKNMNSIAIGTDDKRVVGKVLSSRSKNANKKDASMYPNGAKHNDNLKDVPKEIRMHYKKEKTEMTLPRNGKASNSDKSTPKSIQPSHSGETPSERSARINDIITEHLREKDEEITVIYSKKKPLVEDESSLSEKYRLLSAGKTISEKLDIIEKGIEENGGIGYEEFMIMLEAGKMLMGCDEKEENKGHKCESNKGKNHVIQPVKKIKLHICAHCLKEEELPRSFKKCSRCKAENFPEPRYYCSRDCQVEDWEESHRDEHQRKLKK